MPDIKVPQPGPAKLTRNSGPDEWLKAALNNQHLPEVIMKKLCEICKELLMEGETLTVSFLQSPNLCDVYFRVQHSASFHTGDSMW